MRLNSKVSPDDAEYAPTQQKEETDRFAPPDQSVPFLMESSLFESRAVAHNSENRSLREAPLPKSWPSGPRSLRERGSSTYASYLWDAIVTLFPVIFLGGHPFIPLNTGRWMSKIWAYANRRLLGGSPRRFRSSFR